MILNCYSFGGMEIMLLKFLISNYGGIWSRVFEVFNLY